MGKSAEEQQGVRDQNNSCGPWPKTEGTRGSGRKLQIKLSKRISFPLFTWAHRGPACVARPVSNRVGIGFDAGL